ncbi:DUF969 domain-containing protein [Falsarthrobacter nasiphocae]|uniref:Membrane protein n=1 Tax=Falsarthrobacter nasiphocae TaxID=189863 RepID=A0AAE3YIC2_9MICC|nr:DUF969 domain-containing protein [Falsarthrobacter nasiphocae]MDR6892812.1 putative membrane protein [Falsarthrobacter nasiphocae]
MQDFFTSIQSWSPILGVVLVVIGFALRLNPLIVVTVAGIAAALLAGIDPITILSTFGTGFTNSRSISVAFIVLPIIGLAERFGLQQQAKRLVSRLATLTAGRLLAIYLFFRQASSALGLTSLGGPAQMVRPVVYPMAEGAVARKHGDYLPERVRERVKGHSAGADTVGLFFGEDCFVAIGSVLLITAFVDSTYGLTLDAIQIAVWAIPTAIAAFLIHGFRLLRLDGVVERDMKAAIAEGWTPEQEEADQRAAEQAALAAARESEARA